MNRSAGLAAGGLVVACVVACNKFGSSSTSDNANKTTPANSASKPVVKVVDVPALVGKSVADVKKTLGPSKDDTSKISWRWEYELGNLSVIEDVKDKTKVGSISFSANAIVVGNSVGMGFKTYKELGDVVGFDTTSKTPTEETKDDTGAVSFEKVSINGITLDEVRFQKVSGSFTMVTFSQNRGY